MKFCVIDLDERWRREIEVLFQLFQSHDDELIFESNSMVDDLSISFQFEIKNERVHVEAIIRSHLKESVFQNERKILGKNEVETNKAIKQGISHVWLQALEYITGRTHEWGILTGIRPTKLYHQMSRHMSYDEVDQILEKEYRLQPQKIALLRKIVQRQLQVIPDLYHIDEEMSIYIGIPFCPTKCAYCTFPAYAIAGRNGTVEDFLSGLHGEIKSIGNWLKDSGRKVTTIYFGGGTPTSIEADQLDEIFEHLNRWIDLPSVREITVEAGRPDTITKEKIEVLHRWNVDRISINPQTFIQDTLDVIGRHHTVDETVEKFHLARQMNVENINMDLIIGLPGEMLQELQYSLSQIETLKPESLTIHTMAFKRASYLTQNRQEFDITDATEIKRMMGFAANWTEQHNYEPYYLYRQKNMLGNLENVGYSVIGKESLYNILIMEEKQTIIGLGSGAASKLIPPKTGKVIRFPNPKEPRAYIETVKDSTVKKIEQLNEIFRL